MLNRLLTCLCIAAGLAWLGVWLEFNRYEQHFLTTRGLNNDAVCYGWPRAMYFADPLSDRFDFELGQQVSWWEWDRIAWNVATLLVGWLLLGLTWDAARSLWQTRRLSLRQYLVGMTAVAGLLACAGIQYRSAVELHGFMHEVTLFGGGCDYVNTFPGYLVDRLPPEYTHWQRSLVGLNLQLEAMYRPQGYEHAGPLKVPADQRVRYLHFSAKDERIARNLQNLERDRVRYLSVIGFARYEAVESVLANQTQVQILSLGLDYRAGKLNEWPAALSGQVRALELDVRSESSGPFQKHGMFPELRLLHLGNSPNFAAVVPELPSMPHLAQVDFSWTDATSEEIFAWLANCQALREVSFPRPGDVEISQGGELVRAAMDEAILDWAAARQLECVTDVYRHHSPFTAYSDARLRVALAESPTFIWFAEDRAFARFTAFHRWAKEHIPQTTRIQNFIQAKNTEGVPVLHSKGNFFPFAAMTRDHYGLDGPTILIFGDGPTAVRLTTELAPICRVIHMTNVETAFLLAPSIDQ